jgi:hypothetical protein
MVRWYSSHFKLTTTWISATGDIAAFRQMIVLLRRGLSPTFHHMISGFITAFWSLIAASQLESIRERQRAAGSHGISLPQTNHVTW